MSRRFFSLIWEPEGTGREWVEMPQSETDSFSFGGYSSADVMVEDDPDLGFVMHHLVHRPYGWETHELRRALQCCSRYQVEEAADA